MILNIIMFRNVKINAFTTPQYIDIEPEKAALQLSRSLKINEKPEIDKQYKDLIMYNFGTFDDETGHIEQLPEPEQLLICSDVIKSREEFLKDEGKS